MTSSYGPWRRPSDHDVACITDRVLCRDVFAKND